jgi:hypothetical protein
MDAIESSFLPADRYGNWVAPNLNQFPWDDRDFLAWKHPLAGNYYIVAETRAGLTGLILQMNPGVGSTSSPCQLCLATNHRSGVKAAFVESHSNPRRKIGLHVCGDLGCSHRVRGQLPGHFMYETISTGRRIERLQMRLESIIKKINRS